MASDWSMKEASLCQLYFADTYHLLTHDFARRRRDLLL
jgi:hypothetical protein